MICLHSFKGSTDEMQYNTVEIHTMQYSGNTVQYHRLVMQCNTVVIQ